MQRLRGEPDVRDAALGELRDILVRGLAKSMSGRYGGAMSPEDVAQDALMEILDSLNQFAGRSRFTTWATTVATRIGISEMRRQHFQDVFIDALNTGDDSRSIEFAQQNEVATADRMDRQSMVEKLRVLIDERLTEKQRFAIQAHLGGLPIEVLAEKSGSNRNSV